MKQIATQIQAVPVYRDGDREWSEQFPVSVYEDGEGALSSEAALRWEARHKHYRDLAERGELPEPTARVEREAEAPPSGPPRVIETRMEPMPVHKEGDHVWEEEFPAVVYNDGHVTFDIAVSHEIDARRAHYAELAERGELPAPTGRARPNSTGAEGALRRRDSHAVRPRLPGGEPSLAGGLPRRGIRRR